MVDGQRRRRADAERSVRSVLEAAERLLRQDPTATMEQIAEAAGVSRTTLHRHFTNRDALVSTMAHAAWRQIAEAVEAARPATAPPLVALHQATASILPIKSTWRFALDQPAGDQPTSQVRDEVFAACDAVLRRAQSAGIIRADADVSWARRVYLALVDETVHGAEGIAHGAEGTVHSAEGTDRDPDALATRILDTLLYGVATAPRP
jgi:AcrR family transcriptional regulator